MVKVLYCRKVQSLLNVSDCIAGKCNFHHDRVIEEVKQGDVVIKTIDRVACGFPKWEAVMEVKEA